jgi:hypothetical protein
MLYFLGDKLIGMGVCASVSYCLGDGEKGQCCGFEGMQCLYFWSNRNVKGSCFIIPIKFDATIQIARPILVESYFVLMHLMR